MNDDQLPPALPVTPPARRRGLGCFAKGCLLTITILMLGGVGLGIFGVYFFKSGQAYFTEKPIATRVATPTDEQYQAVLAKLEPFREAMDAGRAATVELTAADLNTLIARLPQLAPLREQVFFDLVQGQLVADVSFPATDTAGPGPRFIDAHATLDASFAGGKFTFALRHATPLQGDAREGLFPSMLRNPRVLQTYSDMINNSLNLQIHDLARQDPQLTDILAELRTVIIQDDRIVATSLERPDLSTPTPSPTVYPVATPGKTP